MFLHVSYVLPIKMKHYHIYSLIVLSVSGVGGSRKFLGLILTHTSTE
jgi:hypothetical protein